MTPKKKKKKIEKFRNRNQFGLRRREKGKKRKRKQELTVLSAHHVHIEIWWCTSEWSHFHWRVCQENMGNRLETRLTQNIEGFLPRSRLVRGILIKFFRLLPWNRKSSSLWGTLHLTRKATLIKKKNRNMWGKWYSVDIYIHSLTEYDCMYLLSAWLEFMQLHFL